MDDEAILAGLDREPDAFAVFYRRHVARLLRRSHDATNTADLCAETFAAALAGARRFDPAKGSASDWLDGIADGLLDEARRRGAVPDRARRRLGMAPVGAGDGFVADLEEELVAAARFRAERRPLRLSPPRPSARSVGAVLLAAVAVAVAVAVLVPGGGAEQRASRGPPVPPPDVANAFLLPMLPLVACGPPAPESIAAPAGIALLERPQSDADLSLDRAGLPIGSFDPGAVRRASGDRLWSLLHVVPSSHVARDGRCGSDDGPGACLVANEREFRCFTSAEIRRGAAVAATAAGTIVGLVPDGVDRVTITGIRANFGTDVSGNVYEAQVGDVPTTQIELIFHRRDGDGCRRGVTPALASQVAVLREIPRPVAPLPRAALDAIAGSQPRLAAIVEHGARFWGADDSVDFWVVPVVTRGEQRCAPANRACVVAVTASDRAWATCALRARDIGRAAWVVGQIRPRHAAIFGTVPAGVTAARVTIGGATSWEEAGGGVVGGVLPFSHRARSRVRVVLIRRTPRPAVGVVDASGIPGVAENLRARIRRAGYATVRAATPAPAPRRRTIVYWAPLATRFESAQRVARLLRADVRRIEPGTTPRWVRGTAAPVVVVVGSEP